MKIAKKLTTLSMKTNLDGIVLLSMKTNDTGTHETMEIYDNTQRLNMIQSLLLKSEKIVQRVD